MGTFSRTGFQVAFRCIVAALAGTKDRRQPIRWAKPDGPKPSAEYERRLRFAQRVCAAISDAESDPVARAHGSLAVTRV